MMRVADTFPMKMPPGAFIFGALPLQGEIRWQPPFVVEFEIAAPAGFAGLGCMYRDMCVYIY